MKNVILILILFSAIALNISPAKSQSIRMIQADTIYKGYDSGETSSVKFINHGTSFIYNHSGKLYEMNALTYEPTREIKLDNTEPVTNFSVDENCKYIIYNTNVDTITIVADYNTGKTIKTIRGRYYITKDNLFIYYGQGYVTDNVTYQFAKLRLYDLNSIDTFKVKVKTYSTFTPKLRRVNSIYKTNTIIVGTGGHGYYRDGYDALTSWYLLNFETDSMEYFDISTSQFDKKDINCSLFVSNYAEYYAISQSFYNSPQNDENQFLIYNSNFKYLFRILQSELRKLTNDINLKLIFNAKIIDEKYIVFGIEQTINNVVLHRLMIYDLEAEYPIRIIDFDVNTFDYDSGKFIFSNKSGCLATLSLDQVPVLEVNKFSDDYSVNYSNNRLLISSQESKNADINILDITGSNIFTQKDICVNQGINSLNLNNQLSCGIYFCIIQTSEATISRKFMVVK